MSDGWIFRRVLVFMAGCALINGIIGWLTCGEVDPEV
jgi:hypothetical protein